MNANRWTPEPWIVKAGNRIEGAPLDKNGGATVCMSLYAENAARIVSCVNKLAGHADLSAVEIVPAAALAEAREALDLAIYTMESSQPPSGGRTDQAIQRARRALEALGGAK